MSAHQVTSSIDDVVQPRVAQLEYVGGDLGLSSGDVVIAVRTAAGTTDISLEQALRHIDLFVEPGRSRILAQLAYQFDLTGNHSPSSTRTAPIPSPNGGWAVSFAGALLPFATRSQARRFVRDRNKEVADRRGGTFKAVIVRIAASKEAIH